jgi:GTP diphosphokinase / guanosine-3',5'-bis(diphosphate) 3'-diphosphatase
MSDVAVEGCRSPELESVQSVLEAAWFAAEKHAFQRRKGAAAEPYINHLLEVAHLIATALSKPDPNLLIAGLLHDVIEDTSVTREELVQKFDADVVGLVAEVTDDKSLPKAERKRLQVVHAATISPRAQMIKLADKISNLRAMLESPPAGWSWERRKEYFLWARQVVDGLSQPDPVLKAEFDRTYSRFEFSSE